MNLIAVIHEAEEGGYWAEVPSFTGCYSQGETWEEVCSNITEAASGLLEAMKERIRNGIPPNVPALPEKFSLLNSEEDRSYASAALHNFHEICAAFIDTPDTAQTPAGKNGRFAELLV